MTQCHLYWAIYKVSTVLEIHIKQREKDEDKGVT